MGKTDNIILIGMPASGKSTVGAALAEKLGMDYLDVDRLIERNEGAGLQQVLDDHGLEGFLDLECRTICALDCRGTVIAPGGSCIYRDAACSAMRRLGTVVYLNVPLAEIERRLNNLATRGVALGPGQTIADLYAFRVPKYEACAHVAVDVAGQSPEETVELVYRAWKNYE